MPEAITHQVVIIRNMYQPDSQGLGAPKIVAEGTLETCREYITEAENNIYVTSNGEAGAPEYIITPVLTCYNLGDRVGYEDGSMYDWYAVECKNTDLGGNVCGECTACYEEMIAQDCARVRALAVE